METTSLVEEVTDRANESIGDKKFDEPIIWFPKVKAADQLGGTCYPIWQVPMLEEEVSNCCFLKIFGCGANFCTA
jgi:hypothetical protein